MVTKLTITPCDVDATGTVTGPRSGEKFEVMLNPSGYTYDQEIKYSTETALGDPAKAPKFKCAGKEKVNFSIVLDGTGVVPVSGAAVDVKTQIQKLNKVCYDYNGSNHEPNIVQLVWGSLSFNGRLTSMSTEYTLFKPTGEPLRAKIKLTFTDYVSVKEEALKANKTSPDLTHLIEVKAGDSLPLLCFRIYKNSAYYLEVAKSNGITNFRDIKPGTRLNFPPLR
ncbi:MAG: peptidoglycan-binding protein [Betaproteobacteria bacterium]|nr:peptidoglycan-binding protein [Betaproteobacteria bacterium]